MGDLLLDIPNKNHVEVLNVGSPTYHTETCSSALDVTLYKDR